MFAALLILLGGVWLVWRFNQTPENLIVEQRTPAPLGNNSPSEVNISQNIQPPNEAPPSNKSVNETANANDRINKPPISTQTPELKISPTPAVKVQPPVYAFLALAAGGVRAGNSADTKALVLSANTTVARLQLAFEAGDFAKYNAVVRTVEGREIWRGNVTKALKSPFGAGSATIEIPAGRLRADDYLVTLSGATKTGAFETIEEYYFTVKR